MFRFLILFFSLMTNLLVAQSSDSIPIIKKKLATILPNTTIKSIEPSKAAALYEVVAGTEVFYTTTDGKFLIVGDLLELDNPHNNLTEAKKAQLRLQLIKTVPSKTFITFKAQNEKHHLFVFTDVDCGFCRKLHNEEVPKLNKKGVTVHYLAFPRAGAGSETYKKMVSIWCSSKQEEAMTKAKQGKPIPNKTCAHPIDQHLKLVHTLNLNGTPAILLEDGHLIAGYQPAEQFYP